MSENEYLASPPGDEQMGLFIGLAGGPGTGKTWSAMEIATGIVGPGKRFAVIDTENKRASHYKKFFNFDVFNFEPPFSSERYGKAVEAQYKAGYGAIVVDSISHEHDGIGGYLDSQALDLSERVARSMKRNPNANEYDVSKQLTPSSWIIPKGNRKRMRQILLACSPTIPIIFCFRAEEKVFHSVDGKLVARKVPEWQPICDKGMPFEMTVLFILHADNPGVPHVYMKPMQEQHKPLFPLDRKLSRESGRLIAEWARGGISPEPPVLTDAEKGVTGEPLAVGTELRTKVDSLIEEAGIDKKEFKAWLFKVKKIDKKFGNPSLSTMSIQTAESMIAVWPQTMKAFSLWMDKQNAASEAA